MEFLTIRILLDLTGRLKRNLRDVVFSIVLIIYTYSLGALTKFEQDFPLSNGASVIFAIALIVVYNSIFVKKLAIFFAAQHTQSEKLIKFAIIVILGIFNIFLFAGIYFSLGIEMGVDPITKDVILSTGEFWNNLYFSIVTWTTLGYGDFKPTESLRLIAAIQAFLGYIYMALFVGIFLNLSQEKK